MNRWMVAWIVWRLTNWRVGSDSWGRLSMICISYTIAFQLFVINKSKNQPSLVKKGAMVADEVEFCEKLLFDHKWKIKTTKTTKHCLMDEMHIFDSSTFSETLRVAAKSSAFHINAGKQTDKNVGNFYLLNFVKVFVKFTLISTTWKFRLNL